MIIHQHTKFGKKCLSGSGDTEWTRSDTQTELQTDRWTDKSDSSIYTGVGVGDYKYTRRCNKSTCFKTHGTCHLSARHIMARTT